MYSCPQPNIIFVFESHGGWTNNHIEIISSSFLAGLLDPRQRSGTLMFLEIVQPNCYFYICHRKYNSYSSLHLITGFKCVDEKLL